MSTAEQSQQPKQPSGTPANHPTTSSLSHKLLLHLGTTLVHLLFGLVLVPLLTLFIPFIVSPLIYYYSLLLDALQILPPALVAWLAKLGVAPSREWLLVFAKGVNKVAMVLLVPWGLFWVAGVSHALLGVRGRGDGVGSTAPKDEPSKLALAGMLLGALPIVLNWCVAFLAAAQGQL